MKTRWIASTSLSAVRAIVLTGSGRTVDPPKLAGVDAATALTLQKIGLQIDRRLVDASVRSSRFYAELIDHLTASDDDELPSIRAIELILLRCGVSVLSVDQIGGGVNRDLAAAAEALRRANPRLGEQLRLRMGPLRGAFDAYGPGVLRRVGRTIWNGPEPVDWWPKTVAVHGVMPWAGGGSDAHPTDPAVWIESMLTDRDGRVPEWMRLAFQILRVASGRNTGSGSHAGDAAESLPWSTGMIPVLIDAAADAGATAMTDRKDFAGTVEVALRLWRANRTAIAADAPALADHLAQWWWSIRDVPSPFPKKLQTLRTLVGSG